MEIYRYYILNKVQKKREKEEELNEWRAGGWMMKKERIF